MNTTHETVEAELLRIVRRMLEAIHAGDLETYAAYADPGLSCFEQDVCPYRIDGLGFHLSLMDAMRGSEAYARLVRFDMLHPRVQIHGSCAVVSYTRLMTFMEDSGPRFRACNESRVFVRADDAWRMIHFHRTEAPV